MFERHLPSPCWQHRFVEELRDPSLPLKETGEGICSEGSSLPAPDFDFFFVEPQLFTGRSSQTETAVIGCGKGNSVGPCPSGSRTTSALVELSFLHTFGQFFVLFPSHFLLRLLR